ncbi:ligand-binding protein SH3 [Candidatus Kuenenbacteria bacterium HGW-Kuenenbacteria-1]|uniref:Ligand-binding protein SH3 n=1 Tax=Candidatus Kuenenbacteria bacterium HGW-Kuenenbacteria-1 TaxID=2013812 RepID=A0A2N1UPC1_9BACT|nr:MAG: ligand-binding protein SH3 [Candidatus Kuenenbacteria bacterium HGW-Kuenenbacteria-1]
MILGNEQLMTLLIAMTPINELRGTIPIAIGIYKLPVFEAFFWAVFGNMIPIFFLLWFFGSLSKILMERFYFFNRFFTWLFERTRKNFYQKFKQYGNIALIIFVAIPLPMTGAWSGAVAAFLFGIPYWKALGLIFVGVLLAGLIITLITMGILAYNI